MKHTLKYTVLACAIVQAFSIPSSQAQEQVQSVLVSGSKWVPTDRASIGGFSDAPLLETPASISALTLNQMQELSIRSVS